MYKRVDLGKRHEEYQLVGTFDSQPDGSLLTPLFQQASAKKGAWWDV